MRGYDEAGGELEPQHERPFPGGAAEKRRGLRAGRQRGRCRCHCTASAWTTVWWSSAACATTAPRMAAEPRARERSQPPSKLMMVSSLATEAECPSRQGPV